MSKCSITGGARCWACTPTKTNMPHFDINTSASGTYRVALLPCRWPVSHSVAQPSAQFGTGCTAHTQQGTPCSDSWTEYSATDTDFAASKSSRPAHQRPFVILPTSSSSVCCCLPRPRCGRRCALLPLPPLLLVFCFFAFCWLAQLPLAVPAAKSSSLVSPSSTGALPAVAAVEEIGPCSCLYSCFVNTTTWLPSCLRVEPCGKQTDASANNGAQGQTRDSNTLSAQRAGSLVRMHDKVAHCSQGCNTAQGAGQQRHVGDTEVLQRTAGCGSKARQARCCNTVPCMAAMTHLGHCYDVISTVICRQCP